MTSEDKDAKSTPDLSELSSSVSAASAGGGGESTIQQKLQEAMTQGQESGLLSSEQLQDGSLQEKVKAAMEKGEAPGGVLNKIMGGGGGGGMNNPLSNYGNNFGNTIEEKLSPVGNVMGKGFEQVGRPVGGLVNPLVGGLMRSGGAFGDVVGVGSGNMDKKNAAREAQREELSKEIGGKEQSGENPLGL